MTDHLHPYMDATRKGWEVGLIDSRTRRKSHVKVFKVTTEWQHIVVNQEEVYYQAHKEAKRLATLTKERRNESVNRNPELVAHDDAGRRNHTA